MGISRKLVQRISSEARKAALDILNKDGYLTREQLAEKYNLHIQKVFRLIKNNKLPYDSDLGAIKEEKFLKWKKTNEHLLIDQRKDNHFGKLKKDKE